MVNYELTLWPLIGGHELAQAPVEVEKLPEDGTSISDPDEVVVLDLSNHQLLGLAAGGRQPITFTSSSSDVGDVQAAAQTALNDYTSGDYELKAGLAGHRCTPLGCIGGGAAAGHHVFLVAEDGSTCGDTAMCNGAARLALRFAASASPS